MIDRLLLTENISEKELFLDNKLPIKHIFCHQCKKQ
jgi:hypothetical protein